MHAMKRANFKFRGEEFLVNNITWKEEPDSHHTAIFETTLAGKARGEEREMLPEIKRVIYNDPATIVLWEDGTKTVVKCQGWDEYDEQTGLLMCIAKKAYGNSGKFNDILAEHVPESTSIEEVCNQFIEALGDALDSIKGVLRGE